VVARPTIFTKGRAYFNTYLTPEQNEWLVKYCHDQSVAKGRMVSRSSIVRQLLEDFQRAEGNETAGNQPARG
jgi:hypothetical protein